MCHTIYHAIKSIAVLHGIEDLEDYRALFRALMYNDISNLVKER